jgi:hypothetical protein
MRKILIAFLLLSSICAQSQISKTWLNGQNGQIRWDTTTVVRTPSLTAYLLKSDSTLFATNYRLDSTRSGLDTRINLRVKYTDTTALLSPYMRKVDTTVMLLPYLRKVDTTAMLTPYLHEVDTTAMLSPYARKVSPTFTGTVTIPSPFTLGATSVTATGTELNYLSGVTSGIQSQINGKQSTITFGTGVQTALGVNVGTAGSIVVNGGALGTPSSGTGTNLTGIPESGVTNLVSDLSGKQSTITFGTGVQTALGVNIGSAGAPVLFNGAGGTPSSLTGTNITGTASGLTAGNVTTNANLTGVITSVGNATAIASQTGTGAKFVVDNTPTLITPVLGVAKATSINTGTTLNGIIFGKSTTDIALASTAHAGTFGNESTGQNLAGGTYSTGVGWQARNNGAIGVLHLNPVGGDVRIGFNAPAGASNVQLYQTGTGTADYTSFEGRNGAGGLTDAISMRCYGTAYTTSGAAVQDGGSLLTGTLLSGGLSVGTQASADLRFYSANTLRTTIDASGHTVHTARVEFSKGASVASAGDLTLGSAGNVFSITGTTQINAITTTSWQAGSEITLIFAASVTVKTNTAGGAGTAKMLLNGGVDMSATANDVLKLVYDGTNWLETSRSIN